MIVTVLLIICNLLATNYSPEELTHNYIAQFAELSVIEMHRTGVPASITLGQAILESNSGTSTLALKSNNHFGIKCKSWWNGSSYYHKDDDKDQYGNLIKSCFRAYDRIEDSYIDHSNFLKQSGHYAQLFQLEKNDFEGWANGLKQCGYATDTAYSKKLINIIKKYKLYLFDVQKDPRTWIGDEE